MRIRGSTSHCDVEPRAAHKKEARGNNGSFAGGSCLCTISLMMVILWVLPGDFFARRRGLWGEGALMIATGSNECNVPKNPHEVPDGPGKVSDSCRKIGLTVDVVVEERLANFGERRTAFGVGSDGIPVAPPRRRGPAGSGSLSGGGRWNSQALQHP